MWLFGFEASIARFNPYSLIVYYQIFDSKLSTNDRH